MSTAFCTVPLRSNCMYTATVLSLLFILSEIAGKNDVQQMPNDQNQTTENQATNRLNEVGTQSFPDTHQIIDSGLEKTIETQINPIEPPVPASRTGTGGILFTPKVDHS